MIDESALRERARRKLQEWAAEDTIRIAMAGLGGFAAGFGIAVIVL
jgi:hypothetical protein